MYSIGVLFIVKHTVISVKPNSIYLRLGNEMVMLIRKGIQKIPPLKPITQSIKPSLLSNVTK